MLDAIVVVIEGLPSVLLEVEINLDHALYILSGEFVWKIGGFFAYTCLLLCFLNRANRSRFLFKKSHFWISWISSFYLGEFIFFKGSKKRKKEKLDV